MKKTRSLLAALMFMLALMADLKAQDPFSIPRLILSTEWLQENLTQPLLVILHYGNASDYYKEHIPGARLVSLERLLVDDENGLTHELPDPSVLERVLRSWGVNQDSRIVVCFGEKEGPVMASRFLLTLDYAGLEGRIALLNGGLKAWKDEEGEVTKEVPEYEEGDVTVTLNTEMLADRDWILGHLEDREVVLVDARPEGRYTGKDRDNNASRRGHIRGAVNIPFSSVTSEEAAHQFRPEEEIRVLFEAQSIRPDKEIVTYCGSGIWAAPVYIAARWLGYRVRFYDGSFQEWGNDDNLPVVSER